MSIMATIRWCPIFPKWDIYQPLVQYPIYQSKSSIDVDFPFLNQLLIASGKLTLCYGKSPCWMGKSTMSMAIFNRYFWHNQRVYPHGHLHIQAESPRSKSRARCPPAQSSSSARQPPLQKCPRVVQGSPWWKGESNHWVWSRNLDLWGYILYIPVRVNPGTLAPLHF